MLTRQELDKIKGFLQESQNPLFFFDNDVDGLCSYLILARAINTGKGVAVKSFPDLNKSYLRKVDELNPDIVFILDKPRVSKEFIEGVLEKGIKIVWIDHHDVQVDKEILDSVEYFNSYPSAEPTTYLCYKVFDNKKNMWLGMIGCIGDVYMPDFAKDFEKDNPELFSSKLSAFDAMFMTDVGKAVRMLNFGLKDTTTNVIRMMKYLLDANGLYDVFEENSKTRSFHKRYNDINKIYQRLLNKDKEENGRLVWFSYAGDMSISSEIANELYFNHKDKFVVVAYKRYDKVNISIRGKDAKKVLEEVIKEMGDVSGGGHEEACGASVPLDRLDEFKELVVEKVNS